MRHKFSAAFWVVPATLAAVLRAVHLAAIAARDPLFRQPVIDAWFHWEEAGRILQHGWLLPGEGAFYKGPLYSYLLAIVRAVCGDGAGIWAARVLNVALGTLAVALLARVAGRWGGPRAGLICGLAAAAYGPAIYYDATLLQPALVASLLAGIVTLLDRACRASEPAGALAGAGALLGLLAITRGEALLAIAVLAVWVARHARRNCWVGLNRWRAAALLVLPALAVIAPVTLRNAVLERDPVLISWNGGINLFMGNDPGFDQWSGQWHPDLAWMRLYYAPAQLGGSVRAEHQRFFLRQSALAVAGDPGGTLARLIEKTNVLLSAYEISNNQRIGDARARSPVLATLLWHTRWFGFPFGLVLPLLGAGLVIGARRRPPAATAALWLAAALAIVPVLFFNTARYRLGVILVLLPVASAGVAIDGRRRRVLATGVAISLFLISNGSIPRAPRLPPAEELDLADVALRTGDRPGALRWLETAVQREPNDPFVLMRYGDGLRLADRCDQAIESYRRVLAQPQLATDWHNAAIASIARCYAKQRNPAEAERWFLRFLQAEPDRPWTGTRPDFQLRGVPPLLACAARLELAAVLAEQARREEAIAQVLQVTVDCDDAPPLAQRARGALTALAAGARELAPGEPSGGAVPPR